MIKRFFSLFMVLAILLTSSCMWGMSAYAEESTATSSWVMNDKTVNFGDIINYTQGMYVGLSDPITFKNYGVVNVTGGSFNMFTPSVFENYGTFNFTGSNDTFSLDITNASFVNNGTATIKGVRNFGVQDGTSFINNGTLYLEDVLNPTLDGFINNGIIVIPDDAKNSTLHLKLEGKNGENGQVYTQTEFENKKIQYLIKYEGLSVDGYWDFDNPNPTAYEWAAANPQDVTLADPTLGGYEFLGWTGLDITEPTKNFTFSSSVRKEVTVTAHWKLAVYTIDYDLDGGSFSSMQTPPKEYSRGQYRGIPRPHKDGYTFNGWIDMDTGEQVSTGSDNYYYMSPSTLGNKTYKASFIANTDTQYKVICYYQNIDGTYEEKPYLFTGETGAQASVSSNDYEKEGFTFDSSYSGNVTSGEIKADNSLELKLYFKRNKYTVTFKSQDGSATLWTTEKYYGEKVGEYLGNIPSKASDNELYEYVFDNWTKEEPNCDFGYDVNDVVVWEDITFYAAFKMVRDESIVVIKWEKYDGFIAPEQTEIKLAKGADYTVKLQLENEKYFVGTREWALGFQEAHIYWCDAQRGEHGVEYSIDKENFEAPVTLAIPNVQHDIFIKLKAKYHEEHDYSAAYDKIIENGGCVSDSVIQHFCYKCGKTENETVSAGGHVTGTVFETDKVSHWKTCSICNEKIGLEAHTPDAGVVTHEPTHNSTGTKTYTCTVCGYVTKREILEMIPHAPEGDWQSNAETHYKTCSCGVILEEAPHTPDDGTVILEPTYDTEGKKEYHCTVCGYLIGETAIAPLGHNVADEWQSELSGHWHDCECGEKHDFGEHISNGGLVTIEPTYDSWGERVFSCTVCGYVLRTETILPLSHKPNDEWVSDEENHWKEGCGCGERHDLEAHTSDEGTVTLEPAYDIEGKMEYRCTVCGYVLRTETLPPLSHNPDSEWVSDEESHWKEGCGCGERHDFEAHTPDGGTVTLEPTYDAEGKMEYHCTVCGYLLGETTIAPLGHNVDAGWQSGPSGHWHDCECGEPHGFGEHISDGGLVTIIPTYNSWGERVFSCTVCGYVLRTETVSPLGHNPGGEWVSDGENHWKEGCGCGEKHELGAHIPDGGTVTLEPTYDTEGKMEYRCTVCGYLLGETAIAPLNHNVSDEWQSESSGHWHDCECGEPHDFGEHISDGGLVTMEPTYDTSGERVFSCTVCGYVIKTETIPALDEDSETSSKPPKPTEPAIPDEPVAPSHPENGIPFIKDDSDKNGWEIIKAEAEKAAESDTVTVDMNGTAVVPGYVIDTITGRDITFVFEMGGDISWSVNGKSITAKKNKDIDFSVNKDTDAIPVDVVNNLTREGHSIQISLAHNGEFGFTAVLSINLGSENAGLRAALYFYNNNALELIDESEIAQDGMAQLTFTHASDYLIVIEEKNDDSTNTSEGPETDDKTKPTSQPGEDDKITPTSQPDETDMEVNNPETGDTAQPWIIMLIGSMAAIVSIFSLKRKKSETK